MLVKKNKTRVNRIVVISIFSMLTAIFLLLSIIKITYGEVSCCYHECYSFESVVCNGTWIQKCDFCDIDPYFDWCNDINCAESGDICSGGVCVSSGACTVTCSTGPSCRTSINNGQIVAGDCCGSGECYDCQPGYVWNGINCFSTCSDSDGDLYLAGNPEVSTCGNVCGPLKNQACKGNNDSDDFNININPGATEICDGKDNNNNSIIDEGCGCVFGTSQVCSYNIGECTAGIKNCLAGSWGACSGSLPTTEICDGLDNDCDNTTDEVCNCVQGTSQSCGSDIGECTSGTQTCIASSWGSCNNVGPVTEICDSLDNDCNSAIDNNLTQPLNDNQVGVCVGSYKTCSGATGWVNDYSAVLNNEWPNEITCDGLDNNCDGTIDNGLTAPLNDNQVGVCVGSYKTCSGATGWVNDYSTVPNNEYPSEASCDGLDNDCDNTTDEGCGCIHGNTQVCGSDTGECTSGTQLCTVGSWGVCNDVGPVTETCDNLDNDCDGNIDNACETVLPDVNSFSVQSNPAIGMVTMLYSVSDNYNLNRAELWRTNDISNSPDDNNWAQVNLELVSGSTWSGSITDSPTSGVYWYGLHVVDEMENLNTEPAPVQVDVIIACTDNDTDGYGNPGVVSCANGLTTDCNDANAAINPGALEGPFGDATCSDGVDNDCINGADGLDANCINPCTSDGCNGVCPAFCTITDDLDCGGAGCCGDETCDVGETSLSCSLDCVGNASAGNTKEMSKYSNKEVFLISDKNWKDVLPLVPLTTWTGIENNCKRGTGSPGNVCVYPTLTYHDEGEINIINSDLFVLSAIEQGVNSTFIPFSISKGETIELLITLENTNNAVISTMIFFKSLYPLTLTSNELFVSDMGGGAYLFLDNSTYSDIVFQPLETKNFHINITFNGYLGGFDADSIIHFIQQYIPDKLTIIGNTPQELDNLLITQPELGGGLQLSQIQRITIDDYMSYWNNYDFVVYVEDDYELALLASVYASLNNSPLIINGSSLDVDGVFIDKLIICVGDIINRPCNEQYNLEQLQQKYVDMTSTDKIILVNPNDLDIKVNEVLQPEKSVQSIIGIYSKTSLGAPILASGKQELILSTGFTDYIDVDSYIENKIMDLQINPKYLTILATPDSIQMARNDNYFSVNYEIDNVLYGNIDNDPFQELAVGRIFSLTPSDVSSYLSRDLFYSDTLKDNNFSVLYPAPPNSAGGMTWKKDALAIESLYKNMGYNSVSFITDEWLPPDATEFKNKIMLAYLDHSSIPGGVYNFNTGPIKDSKVWLNSPLVFMDGCSSCNWYPTTSENLFCSNLIRRGAIFHWGATTDNAASEYMIVKNALEELLTGKSIGQTVKILKNKMWPYYIKQNLKYPGLDKGYKGYYTLMGDPTFNPGFTKPDMDELTISYNDTSINITVPELKKDIVLNHVDNGDNIEFSEFSPPYGNNISQMELYVHKKIYPDETVYYDSLRDLMGLTFSVNIEEGFVINNVSSVEYSDSVITKNIDTMPINQPGACPYGYDCDIKHDFVFFEKDEGNENIYHFFVYIVYGGEPSLVRILDVLPGFNLMINLNLTPL